jgi:uncharacterized damage-inducible protein DinB
MYYKISDFLDDWKYESESTIKVLNNLTDASLTKKFGENIRTPGKLAWHIVGAISDLGHRMGLTFEKVDQNSPFPSTTKEIVDEYKSASDGLTKEIKEKWNDDTLSIEDKITGQGDVWSRGKTLGALVNHQIHHRAQLTVVMRLAGLKVPGVYGPAKEEWIKMGILPQE